MSRTVLVTGAGGFLGARLVAALAERGDLAVLGTYRTEPGPAAGRVELIHCDLAEPGAAERLFSGRRIDAVVHAAAALSASNDAAFIRRAARDNIVAHGELIAATLAAGCSRFVFCSTISVYEGTPPRDAGGWHEEDPVRPDNVYGWSKLAGEELLRLAAAEASGLRGVSLRLAGIHGPGKAGGIVRNAAHAALHGEPLRINDVESRFRLVFLGDAVAAIEAAVLCGPERGYDCYNVAGEEIFTLPELAEALGRATGRTIEVEASPGGSARDRVMAIDRIKAELPFRPRPLASNLTDTLAWLERNPA